MYATMINSLALAIAAAPLNGGAAALFCPPIPLQVPVALQPPLYYFGADSRVIKCVDASTRACRRWL
jgi:hypothetical protein